MTPEEELVLAVEIRCTDYINRVIADEESRHFMEMDLQIVVDAWCVRHPEIKYRMKVMVDRPDPFTFNVTIRREPEEIQSVILGFEVRFG